MDALVTERDFGDLIGGEPFLEKNDIAIWPSKKQIIIGGRDIVYYNSQWLATQECDKECNAKLVLDLNFLTHSIDKQNKNINAEILQSPQQKQSSAVLCRMQVKESVFPCETVSFKPDVDVVDGEVVVLEPRILSKTFVRNSWPNPQLATIVKGKVNVCNNTDEIIPLYKNDQICQIFKTESIICKETSEPTPKANKIIAERPFSKSVKLDPDSQLTEEERNMFHEQLLKYDELFEPTIGRYNDKAGKVRARVNLGKVVPPTRKLQVPKYDKNNLDLLQEKFDDLEHQGVFARPEDVNVVIEHVSPSFLVKKASGGYRLVTAFTC